MSKVTVTPWTDDLFDAREAEFAALVLDGVGNMTDVVLAMLRKDELLQAAAAPQEEPPALPPGLEAAALSSWSIWVETELLPSVTDVFNEGAELVVDGLVDVFGEDVEIPPVGNTYADEYLEHAFNRMVGVGENVWKGIQRELLAGTQAGEGIPELAARLENYAQLSESRARTVARTEVISSANAGSYLQMVEAGLDGVSKEWLATPDEPHRTRLSHQHADDQTVPLTAEFQVEVYTAGALAGTEPMEFPGDPIATAANVINCRCSLSFSFDDDDELLTAAGKFVEADHPRDADGKFMNKLEIQLLKAKDKKAAFDKLSKEEQAKIGAPTKDKAGVTKSTPQNKDTPAKKGAKPKAKGEKWRKVTPEEYEETRVRLIAAESKRHDEHFGMPTDEKYNEDGARQIVGHELAKAGEIYRNGDSFLTVDKAAHVQPEAVQRALAKLDELNALYPDTGIVNVRMAGPKNHQTTGDSHSGVDVGGGRLITVSQSHAAVAPLMFPKAFMPAAKDAPNVDYTLAHEYGHARGYVGGFGTDFWNEHKNDGLSPYGHDNAIEGYAEAFAEWHISKGTTDNVAARAYAAEYGWHTFPSTAAPQGGLDKKTGKKAPADKPVFLRVKTLFETDYEDGAIVAVRPESNERVVWDATAKRMLLQKDGTTTGTYTRGALMKLRKDEAGWRTPGGQQEQQAPTATPPAGAKPVKLRTQVVYGRQYADGELVAVHLGDDLEVRWDATSKRMLVQRDGETQETLTRGGLMAKYKDADGWFSPPPDGPTSEITPVIDETPAPAPDITGIELSKTQYGTLVGFDKISAIHSGDLAPLKGMHTSAYRPLEKLGLVEEFTADHPRVPGQKTQWFRITDKGRAVLAAGPEGIVLPTAKKSRKLYTEYNGVVYTRTTAADYKFVSVVNFPWKGDDHNVVYSWHATAALAAKGTLTGSQKASGAKVIAVLDVTDKPITPSVVPATNVPETPQESVPTPADIPSVTADNAIPSAGSLTSTGKVVGSHGATIYRDNSTGKEWLFKPVPAGMGTFMADVDVATARLREMLDLPTPTTGTITIDGRFGSIQQMFEGATEPFGYNFKPQDLTDADKLVIQKEQIFDWLISNHDGHSRNYVRLPSGELVGIDKGQAFKFFGSDDLDKNFRPNNSQSAANLLMQAYANGEGGGSLIFGVNHPEIKKLFKKIENIGFSEFEPILLPYAKNAAKYQKLATGGPAYLGLTKPSFPANDVEAFMTYAWDRKETLKEDFSVFYADLAKQRKAKMAGTPAPVLDVTPPVSEAAQSANALKLTDELFTKGKYSHGQIVANSVQDFDRIIWNDTAKKFTHQIKSGDGNWIDADSLSKSAAAKYFKDVFAVWTAPQGGKPHADIPVPLPKTADTPKPKVSRPVLVPFRWEELAAQDTNFAAVDRQMRNKLYDMFQAEGPTSGYDVFRVVLEMQQKLKAEDGIDLTANAVMALLDANRKERFTLLRQIDLADRVRNWLDNPDGELEAAGLISRFGKSANVAPVPTTRTVAEVLAIPVSKPSGSNGPFVDIDPDEAYAFYAATEGELSLGTTEAAREYTANLYVPINQALRGRENAIESDLVKAGRIQRGMRPLPQNTVLYRGTGSSALGFPKNRRVTLDELRPLVGQVFEEKGFSSTSIRQEDSFNDSPLRFRIEAPKGTPGMYIDSISANMDEREMLLAAGTKYRIVSIDLVPGSKSSFNITLRIVP